MLRGIYGDPSGTGDVLEPVRGRYFAGDGAKIDDDGYLWLLGRVDDVMNVVGPPHLHHRGGVGARRPPDGGRGRGRGAKDETTGQAIIAFVTLKGGDEPTPSTASAAPARRQKIGPIARRRRSSSRRPAQDPQRQDHAPAAQGRGRGRDLGDTTTLADATVVDEIRTEADGPQED
jgi:acetyl-CoA synthetase